MSKKTIPEGIEDPWYRYWRETLQINNSKSKIELININSIFQTLNRDISEFEYYLKKILKRPIKIIKDKQDNIHIEITNKGGKPLEVDLEDLLEKYIQEYVICENDQNPETDIIINNSKIETKCKSCGFVKDITNQGILSDYYDSLLKKIKKENKKNKKSKKSNI